MKKNLRVILTWAVIGVFVVVGLVSATTIRDYLTVYNLRAEGGVVLQPYLLSSGTLTWTQDLGNVIIVSRAEVASITLPAITDKNSGTIITVKKLGSDAYPVYVGGDGTDIVERAPGVVSYVSDYEIDAASDTKTWMAVGSGDSGASDIWVVINRDLS